MISPCFSNFYPILGFKKKVERSEGTRFLPFFLFMVSCWLVKSLLFLFSLLSHTPKPSQVQRWGESSLKGPFSSPCSTISSTPARTSPNQDRANLSGSRQITTKSRAELPYQHGSALFWYYTSGTRQFGLVLGTLAATCK